MARTSKVIETISYKGAVQYQITETHDVLDDEGDYVTTEGSHYEAITWAKERVIQSVIDGSTGQLLNLTVRLGEQQDGLELLAKLEAYAETLLA